MVLDAGVGSLDGQPLTWIRRYTARRECSGHDTHRTHLLHCHQASGVRNELPKLAKGVYFGYAQLEGEKESRVMVMNVGNRPTFADGDEVTACQDAAYENSNLS